MQISLPLLGELELTSPFLFLLIFSLTAGFLLAVLKLNKKKGVGVNFSDTSEISHLATRRSKAKKVFYTIFFLVFSLLIGLIFAGPQKVVYESRKSTGTVPTSTAMIVFDISSSMQGNKDYQGSEKSDFDISRDTLVRFLKDQKDMSVGVIFYSSRPFLYRLPNTNLKNLISDLNTISLTNKSDFLVGNQLRKLSLSTTTPSALKKAQKILAGMRFRNQIKHATVILITDLVESEPDVSKALNKLVKRNITTYVITSLSDNSSSYWDLKIYKEKFHKHQALIKFFSLSSEVDMNEAYEKISKLEKNNLKLSYKLTTVQDLKYAVAIVLFILLVFFVGVSETCFRKARRGGEKNA